MATMDKRVQRRLKRKNRARKPNSSKIVKIQIDGTDEISAKIDIILIPVVINQEIMEAKTQAICEAIIAWEVETNTTRVHLDPNYRQMRKLGISPMPGWSHRDVRDWIADWGKARVISPVEEMKKVA